MTGMDRDFDFDSLQGALFVEADEPLLVFLSIAAAERDLEAIDVESGLYPAAFGPNGEHYRIGTDGNRVIVERSGEPDRPDELKRLLLRSLEEQGCSSPPEASLAELVASAWAIERDFQHKHDPYGDRYGSPMPWGRLAFLFLLGALVYLAFR